MFYALKWLVCFLMLLPFVRYYFLSVYFTMVNPLAKSGKLLYLDCYYRALIMFSVRPTSVMPIGHGADVPRFFLISPSIYYCVRSRHVSDPSVPP